MSTGEGTVGLRDAAEQLGVHYMTAYRYVRNGTLPAHKSGGEWQVDPADLATLKAHRPTAPGGERPRSGGERPRSGGERPGRVASVRRGARCTEYASNVACWQVTRRAHGG